MTRKAPWAPGAMSAGPTGQRASPCFLGAWRREGKFGAAGPEQCCSAKNISSGRRVARRPPLRTLVAEAGGEEQGQVGKDAGAVTGCGM